MRKSRALMLGNVPVGGGAPVTIQSMTNTPTRDAGATLRQIEQLVKLGCQIVRVAVPGAEDAAALERLVSECPVPLVADIHFDPELAFAALQSNVAGIRINPGNMNASNLKKLAEMAGERRAVIRVGANSGSVKPALVKNLIRMGKTPSEAMAEALCESTSEQCAMLEKYGFRDIKVSLKASDVPTCVAAYRKFAAETDYPLHVGITEAGTPGRGIVKSSVGIGALLLDGIGDTIRVSLTADPLEEVICAQRILESCHLRPAVPEIVSCPTCGRTEIDLIGLAGRVERLIAEIKAEGRTVLLKKIAVMGCAVNGPGEARDADLGLAGAKNGKVVLFRFGETIGAYDMGRGFEVFRTEVLKFTE